MALQSQINSNAGETSHRPQRLPPTWRKISKVPELLLKEEQNSQAYVPKVVSIGPYHHGRPELHLAESVKPIALEMVVSGDNEKINIHYQEIKNEIISIRNCYEAEFTYLLSDDELVRMMLLDAAFVIICMETDMPPLRQSDEMMLRQNASFMFQTLGMLTMSKAFRDIYLVENQIPLWIVKLLLSSRYGEDGSQEFVNRHLTMNVSGELKSKRSSPLEEDEKSSPLQNEEDLHLLEGFYRLLTSDSVGQPEKTRLNFINCIFFCCFRAKEKTVDPGISNANPITDPESAESHRGKSKFHSCVNELIAKAYKRLIKNGNGDYAKIDVKKFVHSFRSVTDLKARGIHFEPSPTPSLKDVQFESNYIYGKLQLPIVPVGINAKVLFQNMIAYEFNPNNPTQGVLVSYINLMKSLIERPEDIKELREKKILFCILGSDKQVLNVFQDINTHGANNALIFQDVKERIQAHYYSKSKTWIAELIHTYFRTPWTVIALFAAMCLLVLTILQTIYTMKS